MSFENFTFRPKIEVDKSDEEIQRAVLEAVQQESVVAEGETPEKPLDPNLETPLHPVKDSPTPDPTTVPRPWEGPEKIPTPSPDRKTL